ncbi:uncharacterized protein BJ212DRAFT_1353803 [Suillus subaureus]|uniref:Secreted protein n=1 Tax=Suillus subaureus TaxID=48587 RepID=A0A9P7EBF1_9AGAM|nr:uncharacterized protein BJ212DRAFT_1353803 [Suillus subaureus]KAG1816868.1 hypothetical protein BJ212DRAFT_1353803 [Suillus subaureus]
MIADSRIVLMFLSLSLWRQYISLIVINMDQLPEQGPGTGRLFFVFRIRGASDRALYIRHDTVSNFECQRSHKFV